MTSSRNRFNSILIAIAIFSAAATAQNLPNGMVFTVDSTLDSVDANPGDGVCADQASQCTLRAAVQEAGTTAVRDFVIFALPNPSVISLELGQIDLPSAVSIVGPGARRLTVRRSETPGTRPFRIFDVTSAAVLRGITIDNGDAGEKQSGGGVLVRPNALVSITDAAIVNNRAATGGGIANEGTIRILKTLIAGNTAVVNAGGLFTGAGGISANFVQDSTLSGNASVSSGAIENTGALWLINTTISHNTADSSVSQVSNLLGGTLSAINSILWGDPSSPIAALQGTFDSRGHNVVADPRNSTGFVDGVDSDRVSVDPLLGPLQNNGGETDTRGIAMGSPAIGNGNICVVTRSCPDQPQTSLSSRTDQRRFYRNSSGPIDSGAFEFSFVTVNGSLGVGVFLSGNTGRYLNSFAILTNVRDNQKRYATIGPYGTVMFQNLPLNDIFLLELRSKRSLTFHPILIDF